MFRGAYTALVTPFKNGKVDYAALEALIEGQKARKLAAPGMAYIPPATRHNVSNTGAQPLEYVYVVAPAR